MLTSVKQVFTVLHDTDASYEEELIGHIKFLSWRQLECYSVTTPFHSSKSVACETNELWFSCFHKQKFYIVSQARPTFSKKKTVR